MGILNRLFGGRPKDRPTPGEPPEAECPHAVLVPHWDSADDIGKAERVASYVCESCEARFSKEEGERIQAEALRKLTAEEPAETTPR